MTKKKNQQTTLFQSGEDLPLMTGVLINISGKEFAFNERPVKTNEVGLFDKPDENVEEK